MFDDQQPKPAINNNQPSPKPPVQQADEIHTMPMEYYLGSKTADATNTARPAAVATQRVSSGGKKKFFNILIAAVVVIVLGVSGWLLYKSYEKPSPAAKPSAIPVAVNNNGEVAQTVTVELSPKVEEPAKKEEPVKFTPDKIKQGFVFSLNKGADRDNDGLTDDEEPLFGTNAASNDSDSDIYKDNEEVVHLYSPVDAGPVRLWEKDFVEYYTNKVYGYKFLYPKSWLVSPLDADKPSDIMITSNQNEFVNIMVFDKPTGQKLEDWYLALAPSIKKAELKSYETYRKIKVLESPDGLTVYIDNNDEVVAVNYNIGIKDAASFPTVYQMIVNGFEFVPAETVAPAPKVEAVEILPAVELPNE